MADRLKAPPEVTEEMLGVYLELLEDWVQFCPVLGRLCESAAAGLMLSKAFTWSKNREVVARGGWFWKTAKEWEEETCLSTREQQTARAIITKLGFWEEKLRKAGQNLAPTLHFRVNVMAVIKAHLASKQQAKMEKAETPNQNESGDGGNAKSMDLDESPNQPPVLAKKENHETPNPIRKQSTHTGDTAFDTRGDTSKRKPSPASLIIAQRDFWKEFDALAPQVGTYIENPDRHNIERFEIAASRSGLPLTEAKRVLRENPQWKHWPWIDQIGIQQKIAFEETA